MGNIKIPVRLKSFRILNPITPVLWIIFLCVVTPGLSLAQEDKVLSAMKEFHQALVKKDTITLDRLTHTQLSYGHSNGWLESKSDLMRNNKSRSLDYISYKEDSINIIVSGNVAYSRFVADVNSSRDGKPPVTFHLKVLEVWLMDKKEWRILARQAVR